MIREAQPSDLAAAARLASRLWPEHAPADLEPEFSELIESEEANRLICFAKRL